MPASAWRPRSSAASIFAGSGHPSSCRAASWRNALRVVPRAPASRSTRSSNSSVIEIITFAILKIIALSYTSIHAWQHPPRLHRRATTARLTTVAAIHHRPEGRRPRRRGPDARAFPSPAWASGISARTDRNTVLPTPRSRATAWVKGGSRGPFRRARAAVQLLLAVGEQPRNDTESGRIWWLCDCGL